MEIIPMKTPPCVLTIAGSDSGAGAGIQADARTIHALGGYALTVVAAVTAQNSRGISSWQAVPPSLIAAQIKSVASDFSVRAIKTGLLPGAAAIRAVAAALPSGIPLVIDPVIGSTSGTRFLSGTGLHVLKKHLLPRATLVTPNWPEIAALTGRKVETFSEAEAAAQSLLATGCQAVLVKGGHAPGGICRDCLVTADGLVRWLEGSRVKTRNLHGTGCVLSAAIAAFLATGHDLDDAVQEARLFLRGSLKKNRSRRLGGGAGPALF